MKQIVFIGSHLGYSLDSVPLGGGAMVGLQMIRHWAGEKHFRLTVLGSGPVAPAEGIDYVQLAAPRKDLVQLSELGYARFCGEFALAAVHYLEDNRHLLDPEKTCIILNDISEGPDVGKLAAMGYPVVSVWHVDVVDFFNKMYLHAMVKPERLTRLFDRFRSMGLSRAVPRMLRLVFEKQRQAVAHSNVLVVPSSQMARMIRGCYGHLSSGSDGFFSGRILVLPWGGWSENIPESEIAHEAEALRKRYQIRQGTRVLMTLSRLSPGKGHPLLLEALRLLEQREDRPKDLCLFICGEPAFMRSAAYTRKVREAAKRFKHFRIYFPGYLSPPKKQAYFRASELFISPSVHESYGLSIVEAMRAGLPILASDHSGAEEILSPEFSRVVPYNGQAGGWLSFSGRNGDIPNRLADHLAELLSDPQKLSTMGQAARLAGENMNFASAASWLASTALGLLHNQSETALHGTSSQI